MPNKQGSGPPRAPPEPEPATASGPGDVEGTFLAIGIGASAGGLEACRKLIDAMPADSGMAFILVQHLDPRHESMMVELLAGHTSMRVVQAAGGMRLEPDHLYIIPPGTFLSVSDDHLHLSKPLQRHGARLPFDFLLHSLAAAYGPRAACVILSGTGGDGSIGLKAVKDAGGLVIAQDPDEADYDGMPKSAIATGAVDFVLRVAEIPQALGTYARQVAGGDGQSVAPVASSRSDSLSAIIELLRSRTIHDFRLYKTGTLERRIERRMGLAGIAPSDTAAYLARLNDDAEELDRLSKDLLINVTSFFRDPKVFDLLAESVIPDLIAGHVPGRPLRIWIVGCSTGEETYSLAMLFSEQMAAMKSAVKLQIFASDVDADAVAEAREGVYSDKIAAEVSAARLARFFSREDHSYRISPDLRAMVVFTVQDVLADPPFSRLDLVSCRNLLIYLSPEAQAKVISIFHFALRDGGILLLGGSETIGSGQGRFEVLSKTERVYRRIGLGRGGDLRFAMSGFDPASMLGRRPGAPANPRQSGYAELCRRLVLEAHAPAAVLINRSHECLHYLGPVHNYLRVAGGEPGHDLFAMVPEGWRVKLRAAIQRARHENARALVGDVRTDPEAGTPPFSISVDLVPSQGEELMLICFLDQPPPPPRSNRPPTAAEAPRVAELEQELKSTRRELQDAIRNLEISTEEQKAINEEALSVNEEFQSTNEELLTSKEELQSLNEELTALNTQLQETLERQRTTANDLQNVLYSTDVATLFLDSELNIRFFTPATRALFAVIASDIGRPLADLSSLTLDTMLLTDARKVMRTLAPIERETQSQSGGAWYIRRILPYRTQDNRVEGVVITFADITERKAVAKALEVAKHEAEMANVAKSRFLAAASHDLRQPLQTLALLQGILARTVQGEKAQGLIGRLNDTLGAMSGMMNTLLDINQIEAGAVRAEIIGFRLDDLLARLRSEFTYLAEAQTLELRGVPCGLFVQSDPRLLEQMIRNLMSNALKYTRHGKVLLGCRRHGGRVRVEVWDTGIGIAPEHMQQIFEEYHQVDNHARERSRGLGLGLSIVRRLGKLLGHEVDVRSWPGKGSVFSIDIPLLTDGAVPRLQSPPRAAESAGGDGGARKGTILVVEDDPDVRSLLELSLAEEGHRVIAASDGAEALALTTHAGISPDLILADYNLPKGMTGVQLAQAVARKSRHQIPSLFLTGDIATSTLGEIARHGGGHLSKPVNLHDLIAAIRRLLPEGKPVSHKAAPLSTDAGGKMQPLVFIVDDDAQARAGFRLAFEEEGWSVEDFADSETFLASYRPGRDACLLVDAHLPGMSGLELLQKIGDIDPRLSSVMITGNSDVTMAVQAMKAGAMDFIEKPVHDGDLLHVITRALEQTRDASKLQAWRDSAAAVLAELTPRQREIMNKVLAGEASKTIAADLGLSQRTVENHRAAIMKKTGSPSLPALARLALAADVGTQSATRT